jgi:hypothetical protein
MDPLTALGLASNIVQFVDFSGKLISATHEIYTSASGARNENVELESLAQNLKHLANQACPLQTTIMVVGKEDELLRDLGKQCVELSDELVSILEKLKAKSGSKKWQSFYQALQTVRKKDEIEALQQRLDRIGNQMGVRAVLNQQTQVFDRIQALANDNRLLEGSRERDINKLTVDMEGLFTQLREQMIKEGEKSRGEVLTQIAQHAQTGIKYSIEQRVLGQLSFESMGEREISIRPAHAKTFGWIFQEHSGAEFVQWLKSEDKLFWISGKPGSGKSTLMKYLSDHEYTLSHLEQWAGSFHLITANHFFWNPGKESLQKSPQGLLRSILYQLLKKRPDFIPYAAPELWRAYGSSDRANPVPGSETLFRSIPYLNSAFQRISTPMLVSKVKLCLFIDGLDEYEGKPDDIIGLVGVLKHLPQVKVCVSSRPWNEFEKVFGQDDSKKLYMQDLTRGDIEIYVRDTLENDPGYLELKESDDEGLGLDLITDITESSNGVFLWVYLVVRSLLQGLTNDDKFSDLQRRLAETPTELNDLFRKTLWSVDAFYRQYTAHMFLVTLAASETLPLMAYWYMNQDDPDLALKMEIEPLTVQKTGARLKQMRKRLNAYSKGLLEAQFFQNDTESLSSSVLFDWKVDLLHRTMWDFLRTDDIQELLFQWAASDFDASKAICEAMLAQIKTAPQEEAYFRDRGPVWRLREIFSYHFKDNTRLDSGSINRPSNPTRESRMDLLVKELNRTIQVQESIVNFTSEDLCWNLTWESEEAAADRLTRPSIWSKVSAGASSFLKKML